MKEEMSLREQEEKIITNLSDITNFFQEYKRCQKCNEFELLESSISRRELVKKATNYKDKFDFYIPFNSLNIDSETQYICKMIKSNRTTGRGSNNSHNSRGSNNSRKDVKDKKEKKDRRTHGGRNKRNFQKKNS